MKLTPIDDLPPDIQKLAVAATELRHLNSNTVGQIERLGGGIDLNMARIEHLMTSLFELEIITEAQLWAIALDWEKKLKPQLKASLERLQAMHREAMEARKAEAIRPKLIVPGR